MKFFLALVISFITCVVSMAEEYVSQKRFGEKVVSTLYFFNGDECYAAKRSIRENMKQVVDTKTIWDIYYNGKLLATIDPKTKNIEYIKIPADMYVAKVRTNSKFPDDVDVSGFKLVKDDKILRIWNVSKNSLRILSQSDLESIEARDSKVPNPGIDAPTKKEAEATMLKFIPQVSEEANKPAQTDGDKPSN